MTRREQLVLLFVGCSIIIGSAVMFFIRTPDANVPVIEEIETPEKESPPASTVNPPEVLPVVVSVQGSVQTPGVYQFDQTARVADALESAGGEVSLADTTSINLAARLVDGTTIYIPHRKESDSDASLAKNHAAYLLGGIASQPGSIAGSPTSSLININTATQAQLETLPGIGEAYARAIIAHRTRQPFRKVEDIMQVRGIAEKCFEGMRDLISVQ